jgi:AcrR family transcriptional regulator
MATADASTDRGTRLLEEALGLLAQGGLGAVTHRSVEAAAAAPHGSVTYWFGNRDGLVEAMVERLVAECESQVRAIADDISGAYSAGLEPDIDAVADAVARWIDDAREVHLARLELELAAVRDVRIRKRMQDAALIFWRMCEPVVVALGSDDPERDGRAMAVMVDGILLDRLARPPQPHDTLVAAIRQLLARWSPAKASP